MDIKVLTFNIHHGRGSDGELDLNRIAEVIEQSGADLIGLNEVDRSFSGRSGFLDQIQWLSEKLRMRNAFGAAIVLQSKDRAFLRQYGNALLSRYPVLSHKNHPFRSKYGIFEGRALLEAEVQIHDRPVKIYVTHLSINPWKQDRQVEYILGSLGKSQVPALLLGDFNMKPGSRRWQKITNVLTDVCHFVYSAPCQTFPSNRPKVQLDYIFASKHFHIGSVQFLPKYHAASDHIPIKATVRLRGNER